MMMFDTARRHRFREQAVRSLQRAGWAGALGMALLAFALAFGLSTGEQQAVQAEALAAERAMLMKVAATPAAARESDRARLDHFYARFAPAAELSELLADVHRAADRFGLLPARGDYRSALVAGTPLVRINATLPVNGRFDALYAWLAEVSRRHPGVGVEQMSIKRESARDDAVSADVRLAVFVRSGE